MGRNSGLNDFGAKKKREVKGHWEGFPSSRRRALVSWYLSLRDSFGSLLQYSSCLGKATNQHSNYEKRFCLEIKHSG